MWWRNNKKCLIPVLSYLGVTAFALLFCSIYYIFSRGLRSNYMTYLFLAPSGFVLLHFLLWAFKYVPSYYAKVAIANSCAILFAYFALSGIYEMAFLGSSWLWVFLVASVSLLGFALAYELVRRKTKPIEA